MFGHLKKKIFLLGLICGISMFSADVLYAQKIEEMSTAEFASKHGAESSLVAVLEKDKDAEKIFCGNKDTICEAKTQTCLKCEYTVVYHSATYPPSPPTTYMYEKGMCVSTDLFKKNGIAGSWPSDVECKNRSGAFISSPGAISSQPTGFVAKEGVVWGFYSNEYTTTTFKDGDVTYKLIVSEGSDLSIAYTKENFNGCEVLPVKIYNMKGCFFCPLAAVIFSAANDITSHAFDKFASSFGKILVVVFAIWLALLTLNQVASMTKQDAPKFIATIIKQGFKIAVAFTLLANANYLFSYFVTPLLDGGMALGKEIQTTQIKEENLTEYKKQKSAVTTSENFFNVRPNGGQTLYEKIELYLADIQHRLAYMQAIGSSLFCVGSHTISLKGLFKDSDDPDGVNQFKDGIRMMFLGGVMTVFAFLLTIAFGFYFLDAILQLAIIGAMLPLMIAGWPFKATAQYASTGFKMLLNTFFVMFFIGFVVSVNIELVNQSLALATARHNETNISANELKGLDGLAKAISEQNINDVDKATSVGATGYLILAFGFLFGFKFVSKASELANTLAAGGFKGGISSKIGTMGASFVKGAASKVAAPIKDVASDKFHEVGGLVGMASGAVGGIAGLAGKGAAFVGKGAAKAGMKRAAKALQGVSKVAGGVSKVADKAKNISQKVHSVYRDKEQ